MLADGTGELPELAVHVETRGRLGRSRRWIVDGSQAARGLGTVFKVDTRGTETVLHSFSGSPDGATPYAGLIQDRAGLLYGTTAQGGASNYGTVFKLDTTGTETVLHSFTVDTDGGILFGGLVSDRKGILYSTTFVGGVGLNGTVWKLTP